MKTVLLLFGTRPEAIKMCILALYLRDRHQKYKVKVCVTGQHRSMLDSVLRRFGVSPDYDLDVMTPNQPLTVLTARILSGLEAIFIKDRPDCLLVQGDTTTTFAGSLAAFYHNIPVGHIEAGLRTYDMHQPFPEEMNRVLTTRLSALHFAPTESSRQNLIREGIRHDSIFVTGNTGIDALLFTRDRLASGEWPGYQGPRPTDDKKLILVTTHRRENFGAGIDNICSALERIAARGDVQIILPVHKNPNVSSIVERRLFRVPGVELIAPQDYVEFVDLMRSASLILTDSGGVQEEAPSLGKPVLVMRDKTEREEAIKAGTAMLVGTDCSRISDSVNNYLDNASVLNATSVVQNPFGDGFACVRIADRLEQHL